MRDRPPLLPIVLLCAALTVPAGAQVVLTQGTNLGIDVAPGDGRVAMDLLGGIWTLPPNGGVATLVTDTLQSGKRPQWSPDGARILFQASEAGSSGLRIVDVGDGAVTELGDGRHFDQHPSWHPSGDRIVFSSARRNAGFDLWETDLATGLSWRLSSHPGDEIEPAWSSNGRHLVYVWQAGDRWALMLRRFGEPEQELVVSDTPLAAPSWRPDGTLITYLQYVEGEFVLRMVILSDPPLVRDLVRDNDIFVSPASWRDRGLFYYASGGRIRAREFDAWDARTVPFRAVVGRPGARPDLDIAERELPLTTPGGDRLVIRAARVFDGIAPAYRERLDVLIDDGLIEAIVPRREWDDATVLDLGDVTLLPGLIDAYAGLDDGVAVADGVDILAWGVTTLVTPDWPTFEPSDWDSEATPGPRLLRAAMLGDAEPGESTPPVHLVAAADGGQNGANRESVAGWQALGTPVLAESWVLGLGIGADLLLGADALPASPAGRRYQDMALADAGPVTLVSGLADAGTPGLDALFRARQVRESRDRGRVPRRLANLPDFRGSSARLVAGSRPNGLPPGMALHAELRALDAAGLAGAEILKSAGRHAARVLGVEGTIGEISVGARADLVLVAGDPLARATDLTNVVAVVRNGRFYSLISLLERSRRENRVE